ncbi:DUF5789 family protein [Halobaculum rubrum]|uniref:DUF5789 family protein n=1 Tax=Halobaculum rubrum TaxID=2872158 RepID=UPI001CA3B573|nr:hypothetical protein [Halobaculum rubrum]QZY00921.1 hypothetical protein K6T25_07660 [Halobaculum rubrum]
MADDKQGREDQAADEEQRQRERDMKEARTRAEEPEPVGDDPEDQLGELDDVLESHEYPATTDELVEEYGEYEVETQDGVQSLGDVFAGTDDRTYGSADDAKTRILGLLRR